MKKLLEFFVGLPLVLATAEPAFAVDDLGALRQQLDQQAQELDRLNQRLNDMTAEKADATKEEAPPVEISSRDDVGDLNSEGIKAGDFPGSFRIPGPGKISLAIGGFIKTVAIYDTKAEGMGADLLPAYLGTRYPDRNGAFSVDATLTRLHIEGLTAVPSGKVRGYVEWDLNSANDGTLGTRWRLAYGTWINDYGTLLAGQSWSTFMDLKNLPEGLTEPTVSGVIFQRQGVISWSQVFGTEFTYHVAIEDPNSNDFFADLPAIGKTSVPDIVLGAEYDRKTWHVRLNGLRRRLVVSQPNGSDQSANGWGLALTGHLNPSANDRLGFSGVYGEGVGRYLLGITSNAGAAIDPTTGALNLNRSWGGMVSYLHHWTDTLRTTGMVGQARTDLFNWQANSFFKSSTYAAVNLMWSVQPYLTMGVEYAYGNRENKDGSSLDNQRIAIGIQLF